MATTSTSPSLTDPAVIRRVNALRKTDNLTNWYYLVQEYLFMGSVAGLTLACYHFNPGGWWWVLNVPVTLLAIVLMGAGQHRLMTIAHEASHYVLFRNRLLNELVGDFFCMYPVWSTTHHYRIQHLAHHQYANDPEKDPDLTQMEASGHRFDFPMTPRRFVWECVVKQILWLPNLVKYMRMRAKYSSTGGGKGPYDARPPARFLILAGMAYLAFFAGAMTFLAWVGDDYLGAEANRWTMALLPVGLIAAAVVFYGSFPLRFYMKTNIKCDLSPKLRTFFRLGYLGAVFTALAWLSHWTKEPWGLYYVLLWLVPLGTTFSFFMILRQVVQHGNGGTDRFGNTRVFLVNPLIRFAVFPLGMHYHLPHHVFPLVPHYRLPELHELLMGVEEYRSQATVVEGYFFHRRPPEHPTVVELMASETPGVRPVSDASAAASPVR
jgi:fatty acid desaturase